MALFNQQRHFLRVFLRLAALFGGIALACGIVSSQVADGLRAGLLIAAALAGVAAVTFLVCAFFTWPPARRGDNILARLYAEEPLAHWVYDDAFWQSWVASRRRKLGVMTWVTIAFVVIVGAICVGALLSTPASTGPTPYLEAAIFGGATLLIVAIILLGTWLLRHRRAARLLRHGECYLMPDAAYVGGDLLFWNAQLRAFYSARITDADADGPAIIHLTIGMTRSAATATRSVSLATLAAGGPFISGYESTTRIPVPPAHRSAAEAAVRFWNAKNTEPVG